MRTHDAVIKYTRNQKQKKGERKEDIPFEQSQGLQKPSLPAEKANPNRENGKQ